MQQKKPIAHPARSLRSIRGDGRARKSARAADLSPVAGPIEVAGAIPEAPMSADAMTTDVADAHAAGVVDASLSLDISSPHADLEDTFFRRGLDPAKVTGNESGLVYMLSKNELRKERLRAAVARFRWLAWDRLPTKKRDTVFFVGVGASAVALFGLAFYLWVGNSEAANVARKVATNPETATVPVAPAVVPVAVVAVVPVAAVPVAAVAAAIPSPKALTPELEAQLAKCRAAHGKAKYQAVLSTCGPVAAADPNSAEVALMLAHAEFERGRAVQALDWAKKVVVLDPAQADAYVYMGGAEQVAGRLKAARDAYRKYLELAPEGRYADDLRVILKSL